jgi:TolA-binding protein
VSFDLDSEEISKRASEAEDRIAFLEEQLGVLSSRVRELELRTQPTAKSENARHQQIEHNLRLEATAKAESMARLLTDLYELTKDWTSQQRRYHGNFSMAAYGLKRVLQKFTQRCQVRIGSHQCALAAEHGGPHYDGSSGSYWSLGTYKGGEV